ncbi:MAG: FtsB family cell division protein [Candidatus Fimenecus sp.]
MAETKKYIDQRFDFEIYTHGGAALEAAPKLLPKKRPPLKQVRRAKQSKRAILSEERRSKAKIIKIVTVMGILFSFMFMYVNSVAETARLDRMIAKEQSRLQLAESEQRKLKTKVDSLYSLEKVENYALTKLGMIKADESQIETIATEQKDTFGNGEPSEKTIKKPVEKSANKFKSKNYDKIKDVFKTIWKTISK